MKSKPPKRVSFIGHSLGNIIIRCALSRPEVRDLFHIATGSGEASRAPADVTEAVGRGGGKPLLQAYVTLAAVLPCTDNTPRPPPLFCANVCARGG